MFLTITLGWQYYWEKLAYSPKDLFEWDREIFLVSGWWSHEWWLRFESDVEFGILATEFLIDSLNEAFFSLKNIFKYFDLALDMIGFVTTSESINK